MALSAKHAERPKLACEIGADRVIAARASENASSVQIYTTRRLPPGTLAPGLASPNILQAEALRQAISGSLNSVAGKSKDVIVVVPDSAVRVLLLDFETLPDKPEDAAAIIRFRVKKSLPFDTAQAALSYHVANANGTLRVVAALSPMEVLKEYEAAVRDCGYAPGVVMPSTLAALGLVEAERPTMVVKVDTNSISVAIVDRSFLLLLRTLERPGRAEVDARQLAEQIHPSMVFFEDTYSAKIEQIFVTGLANIDQMDRSLQTEIGVQVSALDAAQTASSESLGDALPQAMLAGVGGALLS